MSRVFKELKSKILFLNISKTVSIAFSIRNLSIFPLNKIKIHSCGYKNSSYYSCQKLLRVNTKVHKLEVYD